MVEIILLALAVLAVLLLAPGLARSWMEGRQEKLNLERVAGPEPEYETGSSEGPGALERRLLGAGFGIGQFAFLAIVIIAGLIGFLLIIELIPGAIWPALLGGCIAAYLPWFIVSEIAAFRARRFEEKLVDSIDLIVGALQAGEVPERALASAADLSDQPVRGELEELVSRLSLGMAIERATGRIVSRYECEGAQLFAQTLIAKWQTGGDLAPVLISVNAILRERLRLRLRLKGQLAGASLSAIMIAILPYVLIPFFLWRQPRWVTHLVEHPIGPQLLFGAMLFQLLGFLWLRRIMKVRM